MAFDPHGRPVGVVLLEGNRDGKVLLTTNGKEWRSVAVEAKGPFASAVVVDAGCIVILLEDGRVLRNLDPATPP